MIKYCLNMGVKFLNTLLIIAFLFQLISCSKDDVKVKNQITVGNKIYPLAKGYIFKAGGPMYNDENEYLGQIYNIYLTSDDVIYNNNYSFSHSGDDEFLSISFLSSKENEIDEGNYIFMDTDYISNCITNTQIYLDWNFNSGVNHGTFWNATSGEAHVEKLESGYKISFWFTLISGSTHEKCHGTFIGPYYPYP